MENVNTTAKMKVNRLLKCILINISILALHKFVQELICKYYFLSLCALFSSFMHSNLIYVRKLEKSWRWRQLCHIHWVRPIPPISVNI